jgi:hypothetical protein
VQKPTRKQRRVIEATGVFDKLADYTYSRGGCLKFFNQDKAAEDAGLMREGDIFVAIGEKGLALANYFKEDLDIDAEVLRSKEIKR